MNKLILIKYGELTTKKGNRNMFIRKLESNIKNLLSDYEFEIRSNKVRMYIECHSKDIEVFKDKLSKVFGIHAFVVAHKVEIDENYKSINDKALELVNGFSTFKVHTKRADKNFEIKSMDFNRVVATHILKNSELKVDVNNPEVTVHIEIRQDGCFIYTNEIKGSGGYPVGVQGKGLLMLSGGIDSPVAGYLTMKRGVDVECIYFDSPPHTSDEAREKVLSLAGIINNYSGNIKVHIIPFTEIQETIYKNSDMNYIITMMRRMMYRISERVAKRNKCKIIVNGESVGQVASQTLDSMVVINSVTNMPVIRPVATHDKLEIIEIAKKIGTYETSILPFEDCCTIFLPKHPVINPKMGKCLEFESRLDYDALIEKAIDGMNTVTNFEKDEFKDLL